MVEDRVKILCVDDEPNVLKALRRLFLDNDQYDILLAQSGEEGLQVLTEHPDVRLVISDYRMPGMTGVEFLRQVCEGWSETVRIVLSGYADTAAVVEAINSGQIYKFIPKPWNDEDLRTTVANGLDHYALMRRNLDLTEELGEANAELRQVNEHLEELVEERTQELELRNQILSVSQSVLDVLPLAVLGVDPLGMIAQCNAACEEVLGLPLGLLLGACRREVLPPEINDLFDRTPVTQAAAMMLTLEGKQYLLRLQPLDQTEERGLVAAFLPCHVEGCV